MSAKAKDPNREVLEALGWKFRKNGNVLARPVIDDVPFQVHTESVEVISAALNRRGLACEVQWYKDEAYEARARIMGDPIWYVRSTGALALCAATVAHFKRRKR
jgi:hypothetical protein